jgi:hypothetical protein
MHGPAPRAWGSLDRPEASLPVRSGWERFFGLWGWPVVRYPRLWGGLHWPH